MTRHASNAVNAAAARLISKIGRRDFPEEVLSVYRDLAGCDYCACFDLTEGDRPQVVFAQGAHARIPDFALKTSIAYASRHWRFDGALRNGPEAAQAGGGVAFQRMSAGEIGDAEYRRECYDRPGVGERFSLFSAGGRAYLVAGYRAAARGAANASDVNAIVAAGPALMAAVERHCELSAVQIADQRAACYRAMVEKAKGCGLSEREAHIAAGLADGEGQADIAARCGVALSSVITYRKRAYRKLKVENRGQLRAFFEMEAAKAGVSRLDL